jgi:hypothetical protein
LASTYIGLFEVTFTGIEMSLLIRGLLIFMGERMEEERRKTVSSLHTNLILIQSNFGELLVSGRKFPLQVSLVLMVISFKANR